MPIFLKIRVASVEPVRRGKDYWWRTMREIAAEGGDFTVGDVFGASDEAHRSAVSTWFRRLEDAGYIERTGAARRNMAGKNEPLFRILRKQSATPIVAREGVAGGLGLVQQNMWNVMRRQRDGWTASELAVLSTTDTVRVSRNTALAYSTRLCQAGMLAVVDKGAPGRERRWRLKGSADSGPKPPMVLRSKLVFDQNLSKVVGEVMAEEDRP